MRPSMIGYFVITWILSSCMISPTVQPTSHFTPTNAPFTMMDVQAVERNQDWKPHIDEFSGVRMALVPPGCFMMGIMEEQIEYLMGFPSSNMEMEGYQDQFPAHKICFETPFWIDVFEVTQSQFSSFHGEAANESFYSGEDLPREQITWMEAQNFCQQRGARLPTEAEWEYAARGPDGLIFPWGESFNCRNGNFDDTEIDDLFLIDGSPDCDGFPGTAPVGSFAGGMSWVGVLDLSGNLWEWAADKYQSDYYSSLETGVVNPRGPFGGEYHVVRGGAWSINEVDHLSATFRGGIDPLTVSEHLGFRCAKSFK